MDILKLTSIRLSKSALARASHLSRELGFYQSSHVLRIAIWVGLKVLTPGVLHQLSLMMWDEEEKGIRFSLEDVLRAADVLLENPKSSE